LVQAAFSSLALCIIFSAYFLTLSAYISSGEIPMPLVGVNRIKNAYGSFCGINGKDQLLCWGSDMVTGKEALAPKFVSSGPWQQVGVGREHMCALHKENKFVYCMGSGSNGQLGNGSPLGEVTQLRKLTPVVGGKKFDYLSVGDDHTCAIGEKKNAFCWGNNEYGQLGTGDNVSTSTPLEVFSSNDSWDTISAGSQHTCATKNGLEAWCWGNNVYKEVNSSPETMVLTPSKIAGNWRGISAGDGYTLAIDGTSKGFGWGLNERIDIDFAFGGMLGDNSLSMCYDPTTETLCQEADGIDFDATLTRAESIVPIAGGHLWKSISAGGRVPCGILESGEMLCWGYTLGEAYVDGSPQSLTPVPIEGDQSNATWTAVSSGIAGSRCGIQADGSGWCWGLNEFDCEDNCPLGDGTRENSPTPVKLVGVKDWLGFPGDISIAIPPETEAAPPVISVDVTDIIQDAVAPRSPPQSAAQGMSYWGIRALAAHCAAIFVLFQ
jgi:alpha-tubulin suppressor-like RCC1 family protein